MISCLIILRMRNISDKICGENLNTHFIVLLVGSRRLMPLRIHCSRRLIVQTLVFSLSYLHRQVSPPENLVMKGGTTWARNGRWILPENARLPSNVQGSFTCHKSTTWDKRLYFPSEGRRAEDFFALKNPMASAGFEPSNLGTKGQHATSRPPKPLNTHFIFNNDFIFDSRTVCEIMWTGVVHPEGPQMTI